MISDVQFRRTVKCTKFTELFAKKRYPEYAARKVAGKDFTKTWLEKNGLDEPLLVDGLGTLGLKVPAVDSLQDIANTIGPDFPIKIIAVGEQYEINGRTVGEYAHYLANRTPNHKVLNMISLEVSATPLAKNVHAPYIVRDVDWIDKCWPLDRRARGNFPQVQKYCLCGMEGAYTDFHLDFGGTSVWYHVLKGQKRFFFIPPTSKNLYAFENWTCSATQDSTFLGDYVGSGNCFQIDLCEGQTMIIPGAWIHAVYTPKDSLVFGGNFLHSFNILRQLQVFAIEQRTNVAKAYRFPFFKECNWYVLCSLLPVARNKYLDISSSGDAPEDEDEDLVSICDSLATPRVFHQMPYLVRNCEFWAISSESKDIAAFLKAANDAGCGDVDEILVDWWKILDAIAAQAAAVTVSSNSICSKSVEELTDAYRKHVDNVKNANKFDLLDDDFIAAVTDENYFFPNEHDHSISAPTDATVAIVSVAPPTISAQPLKLKFKFQRSDNVQTSSVQSAAVQQLSETPKTATISCRELFGEEEEDADELTARDNRQEAQPALKLTLSRGPSKAALDQEQQLGETEEKGMLKFKLNMKPKVGGIVEEFVPTTAPTRGETSTADSSSQRFVVTAPILAPNASFRGSMAEDGFVGKDMTAVMRQRAGKSAKGGRAASAAKPKKVVTNVSRDRENQTKKRKSRKSDWDDDVDSGDEESDGDSDDDGGFEASIMARSAPQPTSDATGVEENGGGRRYGTRGKRLSAAFLSHAEDVAIDDDGYDQKERGDGSCTERDAKDMKEEELDSFAFEEHAIGGDAEEWVACDGPTAGKKKGIDEDEGDEDESESYASEDLEDGNEDDDDDEYVLPQKKARVSNAHHKPDATRDSRRSSSSFLRDVSLSTSAAPALAKKKTIRQMLMAKLR